MCIADDVFPECAVYGPEGLCGVATHRRYYMHKHRSGMKLKWRKCDEIPSFLLKSALQMQTILPPSQAKRVADEAAAAPAAKKLHAQ